MTSTVINILKDEYSEDDFVYIGRQNNRLGHAASKWANPFVEGIDGTRAEVIEKYRQWILTQPELMAALPELRGKVLGCYCKPKACHGDVLVAMVDSGTESASTAISVRESALAKSERELTESMLAAFESFYSQGVILDRIRVNKEFKDAGFESFEKYMDERQPCGIKKSMAYQLIKAMKLRPLLPDVSNTLENMWTERSIAPLLHKDFSPADQKRIGKQIATRVKNGEKLTAALVKSICDDDRGVERRAAEKKYQEVAETPTAWGIIDQRWGEALLWLKSFKEVPASFWSDADSDEPGCVEKLSEVYSELAAFLKAK